MMGSETFIIVAFMCSEQHARRAGIFDLCIEEYRRAATSARCCRQFLLQALEQV